MQRSWEDPCTLYPCGRKDTGISVTFSFLHKGFNFGVFQRKFGQCQISQSWGFCYYFFCFKSKLCLVPIYTTDCSNPRGEHVSPLCEKSAPFMVKPVSSVRNWSHWKQTARSTGESQAEASLESLRKPSWGSGSFSQGYAILLKSVAPLCSLHNTSKMTART